MTPEKNENARRYLLCCGAALFALCVCARLLGVWISAVQTDVLYAESPLPSVLSYARLTLYTVMVGGALGAATAAGLRYGAPTAWAAAGLGALCIFLDAVSAWVIDAVGGAVWGPLLWLAALTDAANFLWDALLLLLAVRIARRTADRAPLRALLCGAAIVFAGWWIPQIVRDVSFLIEVEFAPYARETAQIVGGHLQLLFRFGLLWLAAAAAYRLGLRGMQKNVADGAY